MPHRCRFEVVAITTCAESQPIRSRRHAISARVTMSRRAIGLAPFKPIEMLTTRWPTKRSTRQPRGMSVVETAKLGEGLSSRIFLKQAGPGTPWPLWYQ